MSIETTMLYLYVETSLHAGTGSGLSSIDLPIQRERATQYPMIQGSGIKGKLRAAFEGENRSELSPEDQILADILFGPPTSNAGDHAGALIAGDARILLFPVRSLSGVFAYTTSYDVLGRFIRDIGRSTNTPVLSWNVLNDVAEAQAQITNNSVVKVDDNHIVLEEYDFEVDAVMNGQVDTIAQWIASHALPDVPEYMYWRNKIKNSLVIVPNNDFRDFVSYATEIVTRIKLDRATKTVGDGLWTEEHLPADTLLYVPMYATNSRKNGHTRLAEEVLAVAKKLESKQQGYIQLGGDETVGRGIVRFHWGS